MVKVPWAGERSRWTPRLEALAVEVLRASASVNAAAKWLRIDWRAAHRIMERAVERGLERRDLVGVTRLGIDDKSYRKRQSSTTATTSAPCWARRWTRFASGARQADGRRG